MMDLTKIKADVARYEELSKMNLYTYVATVSGNEVTELRQRLVKAVWPLLAEVERLQGALEQCEADSSFSREIGPYHD